MTTPATLSLSQPRSMTPTVQQEEQFNKHPALAFARFATAIFQIEGKLTGVVAVPFGVLCFGNSLTASS